MEDLDLEIQSMATTAKALAGLDDAARQRVIKWLSEKFNTTLSGPSVEDVPIKDNDSDGSIENQNFNEFADLFNACNPENDDERLLIGAYWCQVVEGNNSWFSVSVNKLLKSTGYGIGKIDRVLSRALKQKPAKIIQIKRSGNNPQAKKSCKLTTEGITSIKSKLKDNK